MTRREPIIRNRELALAAAAILAASAYSCAPTRDNPSLAPADKLALLARHETPRPDRAPPLPPGVPTDLFDAPAHAEARRAALALDDALAEIVAASTRAEPASPSGAPSAPLLLSSQRLYTRGRAALLSGQLAEAAALFEQVVAIDPGATPAWASLGLIRSTLGDAAGASRAWRETLLLDPDDARALEQLGVGALQRQDNAEALTLLARAALANPERTDPALPFLISATLADALEREGYLRASAIAAESAASVPAPFDRPTLEQRRLLTLIRQRSLLLRQAGDTRLALGDLAGAANAYDRVLALEDTPDAATVARAIAIFQRRGADAAAASALVRVLDASQGRVDSLHIRLVEHLATTIRAPGVSRAFADAVKDTPTRANWPATPATRGASARLAAGAERSAPVSGEILLAHLRTGDNTSVDDASFDQLARTLADRPTELTGALVELVRIHPTLTPQLTTLFARSARDRAAFTHTLATTQRSTTPASEGAITDAEAGALAHAWLLQRTGAHRDALRRAAPLLDSPHTRPFATVLAVEANAAIGETGEALRALDDLRNDPTPVARLMTALGDAHLQRHEDALSLLVPLLSDQFSQERWRGDAYLYAARSAAAVGQLESAERWLRAATELQPLREDAYAGLIQIYLSTDPQRSRAQLADAVRRLRDNIPSSRSLRLLQARELASQGQPDAAREILLDLLALDANDAAAEEQLIAILVGSGRAEEAERWLRERLDSPSLAEAPDARTASLLLLARVFASTDRVELAVETLEAELARSPRSEPMLRSLEELYRGPLEDPARADRYALDRLRAAPPTLDNSLELAEALSRLGDWTGSIEALERALSRAGVSLRRDQRERAARTLIVFAASADALTPEQARLGADAAAMLIDDLAAAPEPLHRARVVLLVRADAPVGELLEATEAPARANADFAMQLRVAALDMISSAGRTADALRAISEGYRVAGRAVPELLAAWFMLAVDQRDRAQAIAAVRAAVAENLTEKTYDTLTRLTGGGENAQGNAADLAYHVGGMFDVEGHENDADALYLIALEFDPNHPWAANNVGYRLAERGEDLLRAYDLIQRAYEAMPNATAIVDSMGWARYRVGIFEDTVAPDGRRVEGAVSILRRAASASNEVEDAVIHDHLGDAYWRAGDAPRAVAAWQIAAGMNQAFLDQNRQRAEQIPRLAAFLEQMQTQTDKLRAKILAAQNFAQTGVAPETAEVFPELRNDALRLAPPTIQAPPRPAQPAAGA